MLTDENIVVPPTTVLCFYPQDIFNVSAVTTSTGDDSELYNFMTFEKVLKSSPNASELLSIWCALRDERGIWISYVWNEASHCYKLFSLKKFLMNGYVCYSISPTQNITWTRKEMTVYSMEFFTIYGFMLGSKFVKATNTFPILHYGTEHPFDSRFFSSILDNKIDEKRGIILNNQIRLTNSKVETYSLSAPYDTRCVNLTVGQINSCYRDCMLKQLEINGFANATILNQIYPEPGVS